MATYKQTIWNAGYIISTRILMLVFVALPVALYRANCETAIWGFIVSSLFSLIIALIIQNIPFRGIKKEPCSITYKDIFKYSIPLMMAGLLGIGIGAADQFYVSRYYGQEIFADFANGSIELPFVGMILSAGATVLLPSFSRMISQKENTAIIADLWKRTAIKSAYIIYPLVAFFWFFAFDTMTLIYGDKYEQSAIYFRIILIVNFFRVIPFYPLILALGKSKTYASIHVGIFIIVWLLEFIVVKTINSAYAIAIISVFCRIVKVAIMFKVVANAINISVRGLLPMKKLLSLFVSCVVIGFISWNIIQLLPFSHIQLASLIVGFVLFVTFISLISKPLKLDFFEVIQPLFSKYIKKNETTKGVCKEST